MGLAASPGRRNSPSYGTPPLRHRREAFEPVTVSDRRRPETRVAVSQQYGSRSVPACRRQAQARNMQVVVGTYLLKPGHSSKSF
eukprot:COSAG01_NODE_10226_length_2216_cov_16.202645_2_plen_83_part_01